MRILLFSVIGLISLGLQASPYEVKDGEHLGQILQTRGYSPLWGKGGFVNKTLELNPEHIRDGGNFILKNARIRLPQTTVQNPPAVKNQMQQTVEIRHSAPQAIYRKQEHLSISASYSTKVMYLNSKDKSDGSEETLKNDPAAGVVASIDHLFVDNWTAGFFLASHRLDFNKPDNKQLDRQSRSFNEFGLSGARFLSDTKIIRAAVSLEERPFLYEENNQLVLDRVTLTKLTFTYLTELMESKRFLLHGSLGAGTYLPLWKENYYVNQGFSIFTGLIGRYRLSERWHLTSGLSADYSSQHSSKAENRYTDVSFNFGATFVTESPNL